MDKIELEVFRADDRASRGISSADIADLASAYDAETSPAPAVIGHPKSDSPAKGIISAFRAEGNKLFATITNLKSDLIEGIKDGSFINRSMAFFGPDHEANPTPGKLAARHLGFLGGSAPGIPGMSPLKKAFSFNAEDELVIDEAPAEAIIFTAAPTPVRTVKEEVPEMAEKKTDEEKAAEFKAAEDKIAEDRKALEDERAEFAAQRETSRKAANKGLVDALVTSGRVLPADRDDLEKVFNALDDAELEFSAEDKSFAANKLSDILGKGPKLVDDKGDPISPTGEKETFEAGDDHSAKANKITAAARDLMKENRALSFSAAVEKVTQDMEG